VLKAPYATTRTLARHRDWTISEYICEENNRNSVDAGGKAGINLSIPARIPRRTNEGLIHETNFSPWNYCGRLDRGRQ
jgi:hypothetical protein